MKNVSRAIGACLFMMLAGLPAQAENPHNSTVLTDGYFAEKDTLKTFFDALSAKMKRPVIVSALAGKKRISGRFDLLAPQRTLENIAGKMSLIWYDDGQSVYVYDASEMKNGMMTLKNISVSSLQKFLTDASLYDARYPVRSDNVSKTFYVSGPPVYVSLIIQTATYLDENDRIVMGESSLNVVPLFHTFAQDRHYTYRDQAVTIPGMATVIRRLISDKSVPEKISQVKEQTPDEVTPAAGANATGTTPPVMPAFPGIEGVPESLLRPLKRPAIGTPEVALSVVSNPDTNSLLVKGTPEQVSSLRQLIALLDVPKRHIEMSVWIVDMQKEELEQLGVSWNGSVKMGTQFGVSLNGGVSSTVDGASFMAAVMALQQDSKANVVSRPMLLTQENVPAIFDNSRTFYTRLIGERTTSLDHVTYGTSLNVLPRFTRGNEIEMMLSVEDGNEIKEGDGADTLPEVGRTSISTIARVPQGKSLLIGGYTRDENKDTEAGIPGLRNIPWIGGLFRYNTSRQSNMVRVFLIEPKEIDGQLTRDGHSLVSKVKGKATSPELLDWMNNFLRGQH